MEFIKINFMILGQKIINKNKIVKKCERNNSREKLK